MRIQTTPSRKLSRRKKAFVNSSNEFNRLYDALGIRQKRFDLRNETRMRWESGLSRFKHSIGWHQGGWSERYETRLVGISDRYMAALLDLEESCRLIANRGSGPVSTALAKRMYSLGLLDTDVS